MKRNVLFVMLFALSLGACRKEPDFSQLSSNFVVVTSKDPAATFSQYKTYYISDTVGYISTSSTDTILVGPSAQALVKAVKDNMTARGYQFVPKNANPDLGINLGVVKNVNAGVVYPGWWWGYPGWWDPWYWGWFYPYYYPYTVTYVVTTGTVISDLIDLKNVAASKQLKVLWSAVSGGAVGSDVNTNLQRGINAINQSFTQSPYIKAN
ncbi:MAG: DUF4136 domain-containing protein [Filimonas sp.]|nr:DUF4136 domain-containing protein [Filimonas sp.]